MHGDDWFFLLMVGFFVVHLKHFWPFFHLLVSKQIVRWMYVFIRLRFRIHNSRHWSIEISAYVDCWHNYRDYYAFSIPYTSTVRFCFFILLIAVAFFGWVFFVVSSLTYFCSCLDNYNPALFGKVIIDGFTLFFFCKIILYRNQNHMISIWRNIMTIFILR